MAQNNNAFSRIIALETSGRAGSVALAQGAELLAHRDLSPTRRHAVELMPALQEMMRDAGWNPDSINAIYLSAGPGSFTGLRIAIAAARAMHQAIGCRLMAIPSMDVIVQNAPPEARDLIALLDAKRGQVFAARYQRADDGTIHQRTEPALCDPAQLVRDARAESAGRPVYVLGEGVDYHRPALLAASDEGTVIELDRSLWPGRATTVHRLGWARQHALGDAAFSDPATLLPIYIRLAEAEELWRKRQGLAV